MATAPAQHHSTISGDVKVTLTAGGPLYDPGPEGNLSWDVHATSIVYAMTFFDCNARMIHNALESLGFMCTLEDVMNCRQHPGFNKYTEVRHPVSGYVVTTSTFQSGVKASRTADYLNGKLIAVTWKNEMLRARIPRWRELLWSLDGRDIVVALADGLLQVRVLDPDRLTC